MPAPTPAQRGLLRRLRTSNATGEREERRRRRQRQRRRQRRRQRASPFRGLRGLGTDFTAPAIASQTPTGGLCGASTGTRTRPSVRHGAVGESTATTVTLDRGWGWGPFRRLPPGVWGRSPQRDWLRPLPFQLATPSSPCPFSLRLPAALALSACGDRWRVRALFDAVEDPSWPDDIHGDAAPSRRTVAERAGAIGAPAPDRAGGGQGARVDTARGDRDDAGGQAHHAHRMEALGPRAVAELAVPALPAPALDPARLGDGAGMAPSGGDGTNARCRGPKRRRRRTPALQPMTRPTPWTTCGGEVRSIGGAEETRRASPRTGRAARSARAARRSGAARASSPPGRARGARRAGFSGTSRRARA